MTDRELDEALRAWVDAAWTPDLAGRVAVSVRGLEGRTPSPRPRAWPWLLAPGALAVAVAALLAWTLGARDAPRLPDVLERAPVVGEALRPPPAVPAEVVLLSRERPARRAPATRRAVGSTGDEWHGALPPLDAPEPLHIERLAEVPIAHDRLVIEPLRLEPLVVGSLED